MELDIKELKNSGDEPDSSVFNIPELGRSSIDYLFKSDSAFKSTILNSKEEQINENEDIYTNENNLISPRKKKIKSQKNKILNLLSQEKTKLSRKSLNFITKRLDFIKEEPKKKERTDKFGNIINKKNKKNIKVTFSDEIDNNKLVSEIQIESFKKYNLILGLPKGDYYDGENRKQNEYCCCIII